MDRNGNFTLEETRAMETLIDLGITPDMLERFQSTVRAIADIKKHKKRRW